MPASDINPKWSGDSDGHPAAQAVADLWGKMQRGGRADFSGPYPLCNSCKGKLNKLDRSMGGEISLNFYVDESSRETPQTFDYDWIVRRVTTRFDSSTEVFELSIDEDSPGNRGLLFAIQESAEPELAASASLGVGGDEIHLPLELTESGYSALRDGLARVLQRTSS